jgi:hypothetical protein
MNADERRYFHSSWCAAPMFNSYVNRTSSSMRDLENRATNFHSFVARRRRMASPYFLINQFVQGRLDRPE